jgi:hypothetical protein
MGFKKTVQKIKDDLAQAAAKGFMEDLFQDYYRHRFKVYRMNFVRGIVFGFGSVIGGTVMIAVLLWFLSQASDLPFIGQFTQVIQHSIDTSKQPGR